MSACCGSLLMCLCVCVAFYLSYLMRWDRCGHFMPATRWWHFNGPKRFNLLLHVFTLALSVVSPSFLVPTKCADDAADAWQPSIIDANANPWQRRQQLLRSALHLIYAPGRCNRDADSTLPLRLAQHMPPLGKGSCQSRWKCVSLPFAWPRVRINRIIYAKCLSLFNPLTGKMASANSIKALLHVVAAAAALTGTCQCQPQRC